MGFRNYHWMKETLNPTFQYYHWMKLILYRPFLKYGWSNQALASNSENPEVDFNVLEPHSNFLEVALKVFDTGS